MTLCYLASPYMEDAFPLRRCKRCAACRAAGRLPSWLRPTATANMTTRCWSLRILPLPDALRQFFVRAAANGFIPFAAAALIAEHSIMHSVAAGRPDAQDAKKIEAFGTQLWKKLSTSEALSPVSVKGTRPYKEFGGVPMKPKAGRSCTGCGICAALCPAHAIPANVPSCTDKDACISCMRCIKVCPVHARRLNPLMLRTAESAFYQKHNARREPEFIL